MDMLLQEDEIFSFLNFQEYVDYHILLKVSSHEARGIWLAAIFMAVKSSKETFVFYLLIAH